MFKSFLVMLLAFVTPVPPNFVNSLETVHPTVGDFKQDWDMNNEIYLQGFISGVYRGIVLEEGSRAGKNNPIICEPNPGSLSESQLLDLLNKYTKLETVKIQDSYPLDQFILLTLQWNYPCGHYP